MRVTYTVPPATILQRIHNPSTLPVDSTPLCKSYEVQQIAIDIKSRLKKWRQLLTTPSSAKPGMTTPCLPCLEYPTLFLMHQYRRHHHLTIIVIVGLFDEYDDDDDATDAPYSLRPSLDHQQQHP
uniref:Uncharacterized protein n=1 Tax=Octactis speculum TaxID=3111310 RepID=A0A7S2AS70_9STRA